MYYNEKNIVKKGNEDYYRIYFGIKHINVVDAEAPFGFWPNAYLYIKITDLENSEKLLKATKKFDKALKGQEYFTSISKDEIKSFRFYETSYLKTTNPYDLVEYPFIQNWAFRRILKTAQKEGIKIYAENEMKEMINKFNEEL